MIKIEIEPKAVPCAACGEAGIYKLVIWNGGMDGTQVRLCGHCVGELGVKAKWAVKGACLNDGGEWENEI